jgi:hypothetical protein
VPDIRTAVGDKCPIVFEIGDVPHLGRPASGQPRDQRWSPSDSIDHSLHPGQAILALHRQFGVNFAPSRTVQDVPNSCRISALWVTSMRRNGCFQLTPLFRCSIVGCAPCASRLAQQRDEMRIGIFRPVWPAPLEWRTTLFLDPVERAVNMFDCPGDEVRCIRSY